MLIKLFIGAALGLVATVAPVAQAQTAQPGQTVPAAEPPVKAVPQSGRQAKPLPVDDNGPGDGPPEASQAGRPPGHQHADRAARRARGPGRGAAHGLGGHGRRH